MQPKPEKPSTMAVADEVSELCVKFRDVTKKYDEVDDEQKARNAELEKIGSRIVELTNMSDLQPPFNVDGGRISIRHDISVKQVDKDKLQHSLAALGLESIIQMTINTNTLRSVVKERQEKHEPIPDGITVTPYAKAVFTSVASKT